MQNIPKNLRKLKSQFVEINLKFRACPDNEPVQIQKNYVFTVAKHSHNLICEKKY